MSNAELIWLVLLQVNPIKSLHFERLFETFRFSLRLLQVCHIQRCKIWRKSHRHIDNHSQWFCWHRLCGRKATAAKCCCQISHHAIQFGRCTFTLHSVRFWIWAKSVHHRYHTDTLTVQTVVWVKIVIWIVPPSRTKWAHRFHQIMKIPPHIVWPHRHIEIHLHRKLLRRCSINSIFSKCFVLLQNAIWYSVWGEPRVK